MASKEEIISAIETVDEDNSGLSFVLLEVVAIGAFFGWKEGSWIVGAIVGAVTFILLSIPYLRVLAGLVLSLFWGLGAAVLAENLNLGDDAKIVLGILAVLFGLAAHSLFFKWSRRTSKKPESKVVSYERLVNEDYDEETEKECPICAEVIKKKAIKCRYCGSDLLAQSNEKRDFEPGLYKSTSGVKIRILPDYGVTVIAWPKNPNASINQYEAYPDFSSFWAKYEPLVSKRSNLQRVE